MTTQSFNAWGQRHAKCLKCRIRKERFAFAGDMGELCCSFGGRTRYREATRSAPTLLDKEAVGRVQAYAAGWEPSHLVAHRGGGFNELPDTLHRPCSMVRIVSGIAEDNR